MTSPLIAETATARPSTIVISDWLANCQSGQWTPFEAAIALKAALAKEGYSIELESSSLKARVAELEANERAYEAVLGQRTYNEVALHIRELEGALQEIGQYAKKLRKSSDLVGPAEYVQDARAMKVWQRALYHEGKTIGGMVKAALHGSEIFEPEKAATARALTNGDAS